MDNFEQYSRRREREQEVQEKLLRDSKPEWVVLQGFTKTLADELKGIDGFRFEWVSDPSAPRLVISAVAATFLWRERPGKPIECRVRFDRKPLGSNQVWVDDRSPLEPVEWTLMPTVEGDEIKWMIAEVNAQFNRSMVFSSADLASRIGIRLAEFLIAYSKQYEAWGKIPTQRLS